MGSIEVHPVDPDPDLSVSCRRDTRRIHEEEPQQHNHTGVHATIAASREAPNGTTANNWVDRHQHQTVSALHGISHVGLISL